MANLEINKSGLLRAGIPNRPQHHELDAITKEGIGGMTTFNREKQVVDIVTPPDPLIRVHEMLHAKHTDPEVKFGTHPLVQQLIEDMRLHQDHWPWPRGETPEIIAKPSVEMLEKELDTIDKGLRETPEKVSLEARGVAFGQAMRDIIALKSIDGMARAFPGYFKTSERMLAGQIMDEMKKGNFDFAASLYEKTFFGPPPKEDEKELEAKKSDFPSEMECEEGDKDEDDEEKLDGIRLKKEAMRREKDRPEAREKVIKPTVCKLDDKGPFIDPCGDPNEGWALATSGARIHRPSLRRPVLPQRMFLRKRPVIPGGAIIIDASGSMDLTADDIIEIIDLSPLATIALYVGNDTYYAPRGEIFVVSKDGFRRDRKEITDWLKDDLLHGNSIDLEAVNWLLEQNAPRTMVTDKGFTGSPFSMAALTKLNECERAGEIEVIYDGRIMLPKYEEQHEAIRRMTECKRAVSR